MTSKTQLKIDRERLTTIIWQLKGMEAELIEMSEHYDLPELKDWLDIDWKRLADIDHNLTKFVTRLKNQEEKEE